ncbi:MAG: FHA domain-containing protein [Oligoflexia bacterium]|nr:FHA domain-containing protein [Oligoflexia bacterium]
MKETFTTTTTPTTTTHTITQKINNKCQLVINLAQQFNVENDLAAKGPSKAILFGKKKPATFRIADPKLSDEHCSISDEDGVLLLTDLNSATGTWINEKKLFPGATVILQHLDKIRIGVSKIQLIFVSTDLEKEFDFVSPPPSPPPSSSITEITALDEPDSNKKKEKRKKKNFSILLRALAFLFDICLVYILFSHMSLHPTYQKFINIIISLFDQLLLLDQLLPLRPPHLPLIANGIVFWIIFHVYAILFTFITGVSLAQALIGAAGGESWVWNRFGGAARTLIGMFTTPLLITELPILWGKRSFREWVTMTSLTKRGTLISFTAVVSLLLLLPLYFGLVFLWPLLLDPNIDLVLDLNIANATKTAVAANEPATPATPAVSSAHYRFTVTTADMGSLSNNTSLLLPSFEIKMIDGNKKKISPYLAIFDSSSGMSGTFIAQDYSPIITIINKATPLMPFFSREYPSLWYYLQRNATRTVYPGLSTEERTELRQLITTSIELGTKNLYGTVLTIMSNAHYLYGYTYIKRELYSLLFPFATEDPLFNKFLHKLHNYIAYIATLFPSKELSNSILKYFETITVNDKQLYQLPSQNSPTSPRDRLSLIKLNNHYFLYSNFSGIRKILLPIDSFNGIFYELNFTGTTPSADAQKFAEKFIEYLSNNLIWNFDSISNQPTLTPTSATPALETNNTNLWQIIDLYAQTDVPIKTRQQLETYLYKLYFDLGTHNELYSWSLYNLRKIRIATELLSEYLPIEQRLGRMNYVEQLNQLENAFNDKNYAFFQLKDAVSNDAVSKENISKENALWKY